MSVRDIKAEKIGNFLGTQTKTGGKHFFAARHLFWFKSPYYFQNGRNKKLPVANIRKKWYAKKNRKEQEGYRYYDKM